MEAEKSEVPANGSAWGMLSEKMQEKLVKRGFDSPTDVQKEGMPQILSGSNVLLMAPTGGGKTESTLLPIFDMWLRREYKPVSILYVTPMKSLNRDLQKRILWWSKELDMDASVRHGDTTQYERGMQSENPPDLLISTPEALQSMLVGRKIRSHLSNIRWIIIDEVHEIVASKRGVQLSVALERLKELISMAGNAGRHASPPPQIVGLSATVGSPKEVADYITAGAPCKIVDTMHARGLSIKVEAPKPRDEDHRSAPLIFMTPGTAARVRRIDQLMKQKESVLAFTNTRESAEVISSRLKAYDSQLKAETHHSSLSKDFRIKAEEGFKSGEINSLVCTSSLELGIDIGSIDFIIQFMSPRQVSKLLQRIGRSGHTATGMSEGVIISSDPDDCFESAAIAKLALGGKIEASRLYGQSLDVLMHQIVGLALEEYGIPEEKAYGIIKRAYPFRNLSREAFGEACMMLQRLGLIWVDENPQEGAHEAYEEDGTLSIGSSARTNEPKKQSPILKRRRKSWEYYFQNMSTIPGSRNYKVLDVLSNQFIGTLDAEFVALHGSPGTGFIVKGQAWRILEVLGGRIMVEPMKGVEAAIPAWVGELIPVPKDVAQLVGSMRREIYSMLSKGKKDKEVREFLEENYPVDGDVSSVLVSTIKKQEREGVADNDNIVIEHSPIDGINNIVINSCFGSLVNETLGRVVSDMLAIRFGSVGLQTDPYRIVLKMQSGGVQDVMKAINELKSEHIRPILDTTMPNTELFQWRFVHVAQRAGVIRRDADFGKFYLRKIIESYKGTPIFRETLHELYEEKLDVSGTEELLKSIKDGRVKVSVHQGLSFVSKLGVLPRYEVMATEKPDTEIFRIFKERLMKTKVRLVCTHCGSAVTYVAEDLPEEVRCVSCKAKLVGVIRPDDMDSELLVNRNIKQQARKLSDNEEAELEKITDSAALVAASGKDAVIAMSGRGVGPRAASRILRRPGRGDEFLRDILREEQMYSRNKRFWR